MEMELDMRIQNTSLPPAPPLHLQAATTRALPLARTRTGAELSSQAELSQAEPAGLREAFDDFVGQTFFGQLLQAMRKTTGKPAYFHGGRGEEVFQSQLDQVIVERLSDASAEQFSDPMFDLFMLPRNN